MFEGPGNSRLEQAKILSNHAIEPSCVHFCGLYVSIANNGSSGNGDRRGQANLVESLTQLSIKAASTQQAPSKITTSTQISSLVKQREYRQPDGKKELFLVRVIKQENISSAVQFQALDFPLTSSYHRKGANGVLFNEDSIRANTLDGALRRSSDSKECFGVTTNVQKNKIQFALERGVLAMVAVFAVDPALPYKWATLLSIDHVIWAKMPLPSHIIPRGFELAAC
ncbi:hypothetical protein VNO77_07735 [Canavalia gladiata]|uniref:Uncharacterized protein n=1 Tax=Canavalia gladiata TaxID=3824 RepID=A0AAN9QWA3_CANGL